MFKRIQIKPGQLYIGAAVILMSLALVYSYLNSEWVPFTASIIMQYEKLDIIYFSMIYVAYALMFIAVYGSVRKVVKTDLLVALLLIGAVIMWAGITIASYGIAKFLYYGTTPICYLMILGYFVGRKEKLWSAVQKTLLPLCFVFSLAILYEYASVLTKYGVVIVGHSSLIYFYVALFWLVAVSCADKIMMGKKVGRIRYILLVQLLIFALIINSRSWIIQSVLLTGSIYLTEPTKQKSSFRLRRVVALCILAIILLIAVSYFFPSYMQQILDKIGADTRSHQYYYIIQDTKWYEWLIGKGAFATYFDGTKYTMNIDNQLLFTAFHYGIVVLCTYLYFYMKPFLKAIKNKRCCRVGALILLLWLFALGGLSVFNAVYIDIKSMILPIFAGRVYQCTISTHGSQYTGQGRKDS